MMRKRELSKIDHAVTHAILLIAVVFSIYPVMWVVGTALTPRGVAANAGAFPIPSSPSLENFRVVFSGTAGHPSLFWHQLANSLVIALATASVAVALATPAAYALARFSLPGARASLRVLIATQMFPAVASAIPMYILLSKIHLLDSQLGLIVVYAATAVPFALFQMRGAFAAVPIDIEEAARVDGATQTQAFFRVALPAVRPAIAITFLFAFMAAWNEFVLAATLLSRESAFTVPVVLQRYVGEYDARWGAFAAGAVVVTLPVMALFYLTQKQLVAGLTAGSVKG